MSAYIGIAIASLLKIPKKERLRQVAVKQVLKIEDVIESLLKRVETSFSLSFKEFSSTVSAEAKTLEEKKSAFIVSFLAMLELVKNGVLDVYPNPSNGQFALELKANIKAPAQISILNVEGKVVFAKSLNHQNQSNLSLDLKHLAKGVYLIKVQSDGNTIVKRVLVQ